MTDPAVLDPSLLPAGIRSRFVPKVNGLNMHLLEAGHETPGRPCVLLLHGFPESRHSWREALPALAGAGYRAVAPDQTHLFTRIEGDRGLVQQHLGAAAQGDVLEDNHGVSLVASRA